MKSSSSVAKSVMNLVWSRQALVHKVGCKPNHVLVIAPVAIFFAKCLPHLFEDYTDQVFCW